MKASVLRLKFPHRTLVFCLMGLASFLILERVLLHRYISIDTRPPSWDQATHMEIALDYREAISAGRWGDFWFLPPKPGMPPFPPVYHLLLRGAYNSSDPAHAALYLNWWYMAVLAFSIFGIAWRFMPDSRATAAAILFCAATGLQDLLTTQLVDLAVVSWVAAAYLALLQSEGFTLWPMSLAFGALHAMGMLHKWSYFSYMLPAYFVAGRAMSKTYSRKQVLAAAALSFVLFAPWYWAHIALLPSRLVQASADFAIPFWKNNEWATYFLQTPAALGPLLWLFGIIGLLSPQYSRHRQNAWIIWSWLVASYIFWTIVPNRQLRFLMPGLAPLAIVLAAAWPKWMSWSIVAVQLLAMVNFYFGVINPIRFLKPPLNSVFFESAPPVMADWKIEEILKMAENDRDTSRPITNMTLVANDDYINGPTLHWAQRWLNLPSVHVRGVNRRLCEFSEFVLLKKGRLGPPGVIGGLQEAADIIQTPDGWFELAYLKKASWPLPDGSTAELYQQRKNRRNPFAGNGRIEYEVFEEGKVRGKGVIINLGHWGTNSSWKNVSMTAKQIEIRGLVIKNPSLTLENFSATPLYPGIKSVMTYSDMRMLRLDRVTIKHLEISAEDLRVFIEKRVPNFQVDHLTLDGTVKADGRWKGQPVSAQVALLYDPQAHRLRVDIRSARLLGIPVPSSLFRPIKELSLSLNPNPETPFAIDLPSLTIKNGRLSVP